MRNCSSQFILFKSEIEREMICACICERESESEYVCYSGSESERVIEKAERVNE